MIAALLARLRGRAPRASAPAVFTGDHYAVACADRLSLRMLNGRRLIEDLAFNYSTCEVYNIAAALADPRWIALDEDPDSAIGGFVGHGHVVTKSIFFANPRDYQNQVVRDGSQQALGPMLALNGDPEFGRLLDTLAARGHEVCLHAAAPDDSPPEEVRTAILAYWLALEDVRLELDPPDGFALVNVGERAVLGLAFVVQAETLDSLGCEVKSRRLDAGDLLVWLDLPAATRVRFRHRLRAIQ